MKPTVFLLAGCLLAAAGCGREPRARLLLDGNHAPDVLTEQRRLAYPPSLGGNRFLNGWWPWLRDGTLVLSPPLPGRGCAWRWSISAAARGARGD